MWTPVVGFFGVGFTVPALSPGSPSPHVCPPQRCTLTPPLLPGSPTFYPRVLARVSPPTFRHARAPRVLGTRPEPSSPPTPPPLSPSLSVICSFPFPHRRPTFLRRGREPFKDSVKCPFFSPSPGHRAEDLEPPRTLHKPPLFSRPLTSPQSLHPKTPSRRAHRRGLTRFSHLKRRRCDPPESPPIRFLFSPMSVLSYAVEFKLYPPWSLDTIL